LEGGLLYWGTLKDTLRKALGTGIPFHWGNLEGKFIYRGLRGDSKRGLWKGSASLFEWYIQEGLLYWTI